MDKNLTITGFDLETTGLDWQEHRIVEISMIVYRWPSRKQLANYTRRVYPGRSIDPKAQAVHGIALSDLEGCPTFDQIADSVNKIMAKSDVLVAHNGESFDLPFLASELNRVDKLPETAPPLIDTIDARWACADGKLPKLKELAFALGVDYDDDAAHAADYDVQVMMQCLFTGVDKGWFVLPH